MRGFCAGILILLASVNTALAGAWTLKRGDVQSIVTVSYSFASDAFDESAKTVTIEPIEKIEIRALAEYGVTDDLTIFAQPEWRSKSQGDESVEGIGRVDLGLRQRLWHDDNSVTSVQGSVRIPGASDSLAPLNGGDTEWEFDGRIQFGHGFDLFEKHGFVDLQGGYRHRLADPPDEVRLDLTAGIELRESMLSIVQSFNSLSVGDARNRYMETQEHKIAVSTVYRFSDPWSVQVGGVSTIYGKSVAREQGVFAALWAQF